MPPFALHRRRLPLSLLLCGLFCLPVLAQAADGSTEESNARLFMGHLRGHWDDIHDVIMSPSGPGPAMIQPIMTAPTGTLPK